MPKVKKGMCLYSIERNGCLNGVYTNEGKNGQIYNEVARANPNGPLDANNISSHYDAYYYDPGNLGVKCEIRVQQCAGLYEIEWYLNGNQVPTFIGFGYVMNDNQLVAHYWQT